MAGQQRVGGTQLARGLFPALALAGEQAEGEVELAGTGGARSRDW